MAHRMTSFTADAMRGLVDTLAADLQARTDLIQSNRDAVGSMLKQAAKERRNAEVRRAKQARRTTDARLRFANGLKSGVKSLMDEFGKARAEMASELQAAGTVWRNRGSSFASVTSDAVTEPRAGQVFHKGGRKARG